MTFDTYNNEAENAPLITISYLDAEVSDVSNPRAFLTYFDFILMKEVSKRQISQRVGGYQAIAAWITRLIAAFHTQRPLLAGYAHAAAKHPAPLAAQVTCIQHTPLASYFSYTDLTSCNKWRSYFDVASEFKIRFYKIPPKPSYSETRLTLINITKSTRKPKEL